MANSLHLLNGQDKQAMLKEWHNAGKAFSTATKTGRRSVRRIGKLAVHDLKTKGRLLKSTAKHFAKEKPLLTFGSILLAGAFLTLLLKR